jgi:hypothetical protein
MNTNAGNVAKRTNLAYLSQSQNRVGRDALRRDRQIRTATAQSYADTAMVPVPPPQAPPRNGINQEDILNLLHQFQGSGPTGGGGSSVGGGGHSGGGSGGGNGGSTPGGGSTGGGGTGVQTFTNPNAIPGQVITQAGNGPAGSPGAGWKPTGITQPGSPPYTSHGWGAQYKYQNGEWFYKFPWE